MDFQRYNIREKQKEKGRKKEKKKKEKELLKNRQTNKQSKKKKSHQQPSKDCIWCLPLKKKKSLFKKQTKKNIVIIGYRNKN